MYDRGDEAGLALWSDPYSKKTPCPTHRLQGYEFALELNDCDIVPEGFSSWVVCRVRGMFFGFHQASKLTRFIVASPTTPQV